MRTTRSYRLQRAVAAVVLAGSLPWIVATQGDGGAVAIDPDDIGGVITSSKGPEGGVWLSPKQPTCPRSSPGSS